MARGSSGLTTRPVINLDLQRAPSAPALERRLVCLALSHVTIPLFNLVSIVDGISVGSRMGGVILDILYAILRAPAGGSSPLSLDRSQDAWPWIRWHRIVGLRVFLGKHIVSPPHASILARKLKHINFVDFLEAFVDYHQRKYWTTLWCWVCASDCLCPQLRSNHVLIMALRPSKSPVVPSGRSSRQTRNYSRTNSRSWFFLDDKLCSDHGGPVR